MYAHNLLRIPDICCPWFPRTGDLVALPLTIVIIILWECSSMHAHTLAHSNTKHCDGFHRKIGCGLTHLK